MGSEKFELRDNISLRLYNKNGKLIQRFSKKKEPLIDKMLKFLLEILEDKPG